MAADYCRSVPEWASTPPSQSGLCGSFSFCRKSLAPEESTVPPACLACLGWSVHRLQRRRRGEAPTSSSPTTVTSYLRQALKGGRSYEKQAEHQTCAHSKSLSERGLSAEMTVSLFRQPHSHTDKPNNKCSDRLIKADPPRCPRFFITACAGLQSHQVVNFHLPGTALILPSLCSSPISSSSLHL